MQKTVEVKDALCPFCGGDDIGLYGLNDSWACGTCGKGYRKTRSTAAAIQTLKALTEPERLEAVRDVLGYDMNLGFKALICRWLDNPLCDGCQFDLACNVCELLVAWARLQISAAIAAEKGGEV